MRKYRNRNSTIAIIVALSAAIGLVFIVIFSVAAGGMLHLNIMRNQCRLAPCPPGRVMAITPGSRITHREAGISVVFDGGEWDYVRNEYFNGYIIHTEPEVAQGHPDWEFEKVYRQISLMRMYFWIKMPVAGQPDCGPYASPVPATLDTDWAPPGFVTVACFYDLGRDWMVFQIFAARASTYLDRSRRNYYAVEINTDAAHAAEDLARFRRLMEGAHLDPSVMPPDTPR